MLVYGKNVVSELLKSNTHIKRLYLSDNFNDENILFKLDKNNISYERIDKNRLDKMCGNALTQGIAAEIKDYRYLDIEDIVLDSDAKFIVMLDSLEDPHNFGAIIRTCECAGVDYIIIPKNRSVSVNATVYKTSCGAIHNVKICEVVNLSNTIRKLKDLGFWVYGAEVGGKNYKDVDLSGKVALVIGSEGRGLKNIVADSCDEIISLPMRGKINSLNASVAAGILIYEVISR